MLTEKRHVVARVAETIFTERFSMEKKNLFYASYRKEGMNRSPPLCETMSHFNAGPTGCEGKFLEQFLAGQFLKS